MRNNVIVALICICVAATSYAQEPVKDVPVYSQKEYQEMYNYAASRGAWVGMVCTARSCANSQGKTGDELFIEIEKCIADKFDDFGINYSKMK